MDATDDDNPRVASPYQTLGEVAAWYRVSGRTVQRWIAAGCPAVDIGPGRHPVWRLEPSAVRRWLDARQRQRHAEDSA